MRIFFMIMFMIFGFYNSGEAQTLMMPCSSLENWTPPAGVKTKLVPCRTENGDIVPQLVLDGSFPSGNGGIAVDPGQGTHIAGIVTGEFQGVTVDDNRLLKIKGYSDLDYGMLEEALDKRIRSLTNITVESMERGLCTVEGVVTFSTESSMGFSSGVDEPTFLVSFNESSERLSSGVKDIECYLMDFSGDFIKEVPGETNQMFNCQVTVFAGEHSRPNVLLQTCGNEKYIVEFGTEESGLKRNVVFFDELSLISLGTRREIVQ